MFNKINTESINDTEAVYDNLVSLCAMCIIDTLIQIVFCMKVEKMNHRNKLLYTKPK